MLPNQRALGDFSISSLTDSINFEKLKAEAFQKLQAQATKQISEVNVKELTQKLLTTSPDTIAEGQTVSVQEIVSGPKWYTDKKNIIISVLSISVVLLLFKRGR